MKFVPAASVALLSALVVLHAWAADPPARPPPLQGGVEQNESRPPSPSGTRRPGQAPAICEAFASQVDPFTGTLQVMPKAGGGRMPLPQGRPIEQYCLAPAPDWTLLGEDRNYCCFFAPRSWAAKIPPLPGNVQEDQPPPNRRPGPTVPVTDPDRKPPTDRRQPPPLQGTVTAQRVCNLQQLAVWVFDRYSSTVGPIATVRVANAEAPTYLILMSGMEWEKLEQATTELDALLSLLNIRALDAYLASVLEAARTLPPRSRLILAGHSLGGMEAQNAVAPLREMGFEVLQVIGFGDPISAERDSNTEYLHVRARHDPVPYMDRLYGMSRDFVVIPGGADPDPWSAITKSSGSHFIYPHSTALSGRRLPSMRGLRTPCLELDVRTLREFPAAPNLYRILNDRRSRAHPIADRCPRNPDDDRLNCLWASLAQDRHLQSGGSLQYWARCEPTITLKSEVQDILRRWYGGRLLDDLHGPTPVEGMWRHYRGQRAASSRLRIESTLRAAGPGSRGLVFVETPNAGPGHIFNAVNIDGRIEFWDAQQGCDAQMWFTPGAIVEFFRTH